MIYRSYITKERQMLWQMPYVGRYNMAWTLPWLPSWTSSESFRTWVFN